MDGKEVHSKLGSLVSLPLSLLLLIFFFLPWLKITCAGNEVGSASGWQLSVGNWSPEGPMAGQEEKDEEKKSPDARPWFILCLILPVVLLIVGGMAAAGRMPSLDTGKVMIVLGAVGLLMMILAANVEYSDEMEEQMQKDQAAQPAPPPGAPTGMEGMGEQMAKQMTEVIQTKPTGILWGSLVLYVLVAACGIAGLVLPKLMAATAAAQPPPAQPAQQPPPQPPPAPEPPAEPPAQA